VVRSQVQIINGAAEMKAGAGDFSGIDQNLVELAAVDRMDDLVGMGGVGLQALVALAIVDHASAHGQGHGHDFVEYADLAQGHDAALGQRQIDRAPALDLLAPHVVTFLEDLHG